MYELTGCTFYGHKNICGYRFSLGSENGKSLCFISTHNLLPCLHFTSLFMINTSNCLDLLLAKDATEKHICQIE